MTAQLIIRPRAEKDLERAFDWYESEAAGLGDEFLAAVHDQFERIREFPESSPVIYRNVRRTVVSRFPYLVFYVSEGNRVSVLAVLHQSRRPGLWPRR